MKTLILVRHAKSSWAEDGLTDKERPLNDRGKKDAPQMAKRLKNKVPVIDIFIASDAKRARKTATFFAEEYGVDKASIQIEPALYEDFSSAYDKVINSLSDAYTTVAFFAHSPTITDYANSLTNVHTDNIPTCGVFAVQCDVGSWTDFIAAKKTLLLYDYPKNV